MLDMHIYAMSSCNFCSSCCAYMQAYAIRVLAMLHAELIHKDDDDRTKGNAFYSFLNWCFFLFIKSIAKWYKRVCVCILFICLLVGVRLVHCPLGIVVILSSTTFIYRYCYLFSTAAIYAHFACSYNTNNIILCFIHNNYTIRKERSNQATIKVVHFSQNTRLGAFFFCNKVRWISQHITSPST